MSIPAHWASPCRIERLHIEIIFCWNLEISLLLGKTLMEMQLLVFWGPWVRPCLWSFVAPVGFSWFPQYFIGIRDVRFKRPLYCIEILWYLMGLSIFERWFGWILKLFTCQFQVQTRSADEPMTTFVFCNQCGNRWKVSPRRFPTLWTLWKEPTSLGWMQNIYTCFIPAVLLITSTLPVLSARSNNSWTRFRSSAADLELFAFCGTWCSTRRTATPLMSPKE